jgi:hypothetical protein
MRLLTPLASTMHLGQIRVGGEMMHKGQGQAAKAFGILPGLLLDSRVVDLPRSSNLIIDTLSSLKPLFFNDLKKELPFSGNVGA